MSYVPYIVPADLLSYLPATALSLTTNDQQTQACLDASMEADSYLRGRYSLPLVAWGNDLKKYTSWIACYLLMSMVGFQGGGADRQITERYYRAIGFPDKPGTGWFPQVQRQSIHPDVTPAIAQPGDPICDVPQVFSAPPRGWQQTVNGKPVIS